MFAFQRSVLRTVRPYVFRSNATLNPTSLPSGSELVPTPNPDVAASTPESAGRRRKVPTRRPDISREKPREWNQPLAAGVIPAYDLALEVLKRDSLALKEEILELRKRIEVEEKKFQELVKAEGGKGENGEAYALDLELEKLRERLHILEVQSEVNLPDVRWKVANAMVDMTVPSNRHLVEQKWRKDGDLDLLMERVYQMKVIPDVLPEITPTLALHVAAQGVTKLSSLLKSYKRVEPGVYLLPKQTVEPPRLFADVFHTDTRLYTLMLIDPDVPDEASASYATYLHWLQPNIPLSATQATQILELNNHTQYVPPHPQRGTPYHRYTVLLLPQPPSEGAEYTRNTEARATPGVPTSQRLEIPVIADEERFGFNVRAFCKQWGLDGKRGGGVHMFREIWDENVSQIYTDILKTAEPRYGRPPKADPYAEIKYRKKYIS